MTPDYDSIRAVNFSSLKFMATSPMAYRWHVDHPEPRKAAFVLGGAIHCAILEPERFASRYAVFDGTRRGKAWDEWQAERPGVESLKPDELARVEACALAVSRHRVASGLLRGGRTEESMTWQDPVTGLMLKGRMDYIRPDAVIDLKSTRDPSPWHFSRDAAKYHLHAQLAMYHDGATVIGKIDGKTLPFIVAVDSSEPHDVACFQLSQATVDAGRALYRSWLRRLIQSVEADFWPGVAPDLETLELPPWMDGQSISTEDEF